MAANNGLVKMLGLLGQKKQNLELILNITKKQSEVLTAEKANDLLNFIEQKQKLIDRVNELDNEFEGMYFKVKRFIDTPDFKLSDPQGYDIFIQIKHQIKNIQAFSKEIYNIEKKNQEAVNDEMIDLKKRMSNVSKSKKSYSAYKKPPKLAQGVFIDNKK